MMIFLSPSNSNKEIDYSYDGFNVTCMLDGELWGTFDARDYLNVSPFSPDNDTPFLSVKEIDGVYHVELINYISDNAKESEKYPDWIEV
ncbi:hypothetical protein [Salipaludibacillus sp. CF4.18]|uniref:hypothetical protein n=1 Tax=Salipaludibacillus sp. CF4.18 TaxID=3373081 RepID=UPI003EE676EB